MNTLSQARLDHLSDMLALAALSIQPQVPAEFILLHASYECGALKLDLYGECDDDFYNVLAVTLTNTTVNLDDLLSAAQLKDMSAWCDRHLDGSDEREENRRAEVAVERMRLSKEFGK